MYEYDLYIYVWILEMDLTDATPLTMIPPNESYELICMYVCVKGGEDALDALSL